MESAINPKINSAFKFGYICSLIENDFDLILEDCLTEPKSFPLNKNLTSLLIFKDDYRNIFEEEIILFPTYKNENDVKEYLSAFFIFIKEKISEVGNNNLELAYFAGASLALTFDENLDILDFEKLVGIYKLLFKLSGNTAALSSVEKMIFNLLNEDIYESLIARNYLLSQFIDENVSTEQKEIFRLFDRIVIKKY